MTPQHRQQLEELAKWHEENASLCKLTLRLECSVDKEATEKELEFHRSAAKLLREVVETPLEQLTEHLREVRQNQPKVTLKEAQEQAERVREVVDEEARPIKSVYWKTKDDAGTYRFLAPENISRSEAMKIAKRIYPTRSLRTVWME